MASQSAGPDPPRDSLSSVSTTSIVFDRIHEENEKPHDEEPDDAGADDPESRAFLTSTPPPPLPHPRPMHKSLRRILILLALALATAWAVALAVYLSLASSRHAALGTEADPDAAGSSLGSRKPITMDSLFNGAWTAKTRPLEWIAGPGGEDGMLLEQSVKGRDYLVVEHVQTALNFSSSSEASSGGGGAGNPLVLMKESSFEYAGKRYDPAWTRPSPDLRHVLLAVDRKSVWRHSFTAVYFILDVETQAVLPLVPSDPAARVQLASWSPRSDAVAFTRDNNLYLHRLSLESTILQVTTDGGPDFFYGIPDWVYEEEVLADRCATWWSADGSFLAFFRTNETAVPEYTLQFFASRPSGSEPPPGEEAYPELQRIKYPKAGAPNPVVDLLFYDVSNGGSPFSIPVDDDFPPDDRIINNLVWAGDDKVLVKETNRVSDIYKVLLVDVKSRQGSAVTTVDVNAIDGGWYEISHGMTYIPQDLARGRQHHGYVDQVIHEGFLHLAYFAPLDAAEPVMLTSGPWEVVDGPSAVDLDNNLVYFVATKESSIQRHVYSVKLDGSDLKPFTDTSVEAYYSASFSPRAGFALLHYQGPKIPSQRVVSTNSNDNLDILVEDNKALAARVRSHQLPQKFYGTLPLPSTENNITLNYLERRPPHFSPSKKYPVLIHQYSGPGSQQVHKKFAVDFQSYIASSLGYLVITIDPRGTGFLGRHHRVPVRSRLGHLESHDHIAAAQLLALQNPYIDPSRLCIWGWSYGGFSALKTLEVDAGRTFAYGMAVAPVTDWRYYDSIYAERYMRLPTDNRAGYEAAKVGNVTALGQAKRFLVMHGVADDNVHLQNSLKLLDELDLARVENYDVHVFPDSDHSIYFHGASRVIYDKLSNWLINAFNGEWIKIANAKPAGKA